jgi:hypothetical protein
MVATAIEIPNTCTMPLDRDRRRHRTQRRYALALAAVAALSTGAARVAAATACPGGVGVAVSVAADAGDLDCYRIAAAQQAIVASRLSPDGRRRDLQVITALPAVPPSLSGAGIEHKKVTAIAGAREIIDAGDGRTFYVIGSQPRSAAVFWRDTKTGLLHFSATKRFPTPEALDLFLTRIRPSRSKGKANAQ